MLRNLCPKVLVEFGMEWTALHKSGTKTTCQPWAGSLQLLPLPSLHHLQLRYPRHSSCEYWPNPDYLSNGQPNYMESCWSQAGFHYWKGGEASIYAYTDNICIRKAPSDAGHIFWQRWWFISQCKGKFICRGNASQIQAKAVKVGHLFVYTTNDTGTCWWNGHTVFWLHKDWAQSASNTVLSLDNWLLVSA